MNEVFVVVLLVGLAILASIKARRKGFSFNQRVVLSGIAVCLLIWNLFSEDGEWSFRSGYGVMLVVGIVMLVSAVLYFRKPD